MVVKTRPPTQAEIDTAWKAISVTRKLGPMRGSEHPMAKLTDEDVRTIRASAEPQCAAAARYGIAQSMVSMLRSGKRRGYLA